MFLDHGNSEVTTLESLRKLPEKFATLPVQSVRCMLGGVRSTDGPWQKDAIDLFTEMTMDK